MPSRPEITLAPPTAIADRRAQRYVLLLTGVAVGYFVFHKSFAYLGVPALNLFVGEVVLGVGVAMAAFRRELRAFVARLAEPGPLHLLTWATVLLSTYGVLLAVRGVRDGQPVITVLQTFAFNYYILALPLGLWAARRDRQALARLVRWLAWGNGVGGTVFLLVIDRLALTVPGSAGTRLNLGNGSVFALAGLLAFGYPPRRYWYLYLLNGFVLLAVQSRAEWLAFTVVILLWGWLTKRLRKVAAGVAVGFAALLLVSALHVPLPTAATRQGEVSVDGIFGRVLASVDESRAARYTSDAADFSGSVNWREQWWKAIWADNRADSRRLLVGHAYGYPINRLTTHVEDNVRTPHSVFFFSLAYGGWIGVLIFGSFTVVMFATLWTVYRSTGALLGVLGWVAALCIALFSNWFEAPFGAFPTYLLCGMALAPLLGGPDEAPLPLERHRSITERAEVRG